MSDWSQYRSLNAATSEDAPPTVLYVAGTQGEETGVPSILEKYHGMDVQVLTSTEEAVATLEDDSVTDCLVIESHANDGRGNDPLDDVRGMALPVVVYADAVCGDEECRRFLQAGVDDYLCRETDTDRRSLLARRIEHAVALERESAAASRFRDVLDRMHHGVLVADTEGRIEYVNDAFEQFGYTWEDLTGESLWALQSDVANRTAYRDFWETVTHGDPWEGELTVTGDDGRTYSIDLTAVPSRVGNGDELRIIAVGKDISMQKSYERALADAWQKYRGLIDSAPDAVFVADADSGEIIETNDAAADLLECPRREIVGMHQSELHPTEEQERYRELFDTHLEAREATFARFENGDPLHVRTANGERIPVEINAKVIELADEKLIQGHFRDLSERRQRQRERETLQQAIEKAHTSLTLTDATEEDNPLVYANEAFEELTGYDEQEVVGKNCRFLQGEGTDPERVAQLREAIDEEEQVTVELRNYRKDGTEFWNQLTVSPVYDADGELIQYLGTQQDITDRKRRERELRSYKEAVEQAGHVIMITDTAGRIEYVNPAFEETTGYSESEVLGEYPSVLQSGEHDEEFYSDLWETITTGNVWEGEVINERKNGDRYHIEQTIAPITDDGEIDGFVAVNTDITERKEHEKQLERERDRLDEFASTVAHDLRNPLSIAIGNIELARQQDQSPDDRLDPALEALERTEVLINEVLRLSKQGQTVRNPELIDFDDIVETAWKSVEAPVATYSVDDDVEGWSVEADETRLRQLFENLFRNAVDHAGPDVMVRIGRLPDGDGFFVADDGPGIPPKRRDQIFDSGFTTDDAGTGFGLAIVKQIADAHGWELNVTNAGSGGARFEIVTRTAAENDTDERQD